MLAYTALHRCEVTLDVAQEVLKDLLPERKVVPITAESIQKAVADYYNIPVAALSAKRRTRNVAFPRQVAMYLCRVLTDASLPQIGQSFGGRDHTTVLHACSKIEDERKTNPDLNHTIEELIEHIKKG